MIGDWQVCEPADENKINISKKFNDDREICKVNLLVRSAIVQWVGYPTWSGTDQVQSSELIPTYSLIDSSYAQRKGLYILPEGL